MNTFGLILTIVVLVGVALFILLFEKKRALRIQRDLRGMAADRHEAARDRHPDR